MTTITAMKTMTNPINLNFPLFRFASWLGLALLALTSLKSMPVAAQDKQDRKKSSGLRLVMRERPSLRVGKIFRLYLRAKVQWDFRGFSPHLQTDEGASDLNRARIGIKGDFSKFVEYEAEREFRESFGGRVSKHPWRDAYINSAYWDNFQIKAGKFKIPFSMEALAGAHELEFVNRSRIADDLAPARDVGVMLHGRFFKRGLNYEAGVFRNDGEKNDTGAAGSEENRGNRTYALRITGSPLRRLRLPGE